MSEIHEMHKQSEKLAVETIENHLATQAWQVKAILFIAPLKKRIVKGTAFIDHNQVID